MTGKRKFGSKEGMASKADMEQPLFMCMAMFFVPAHNNPNLCSHEQILAALHREHIDLSNMRYCGPALGSLLSAVRTDLVSAPWCIMSSSHSCDQLISEIASKCLAWSLLKIPLRSILPADACSSIHAFEKKFYYMERDGALCNTLCYKNMPRDVAVHVWQDLFSHQVSRVRSSGSLVWVTYGTTQVCVHEFYDVLVNRRSLTLLDGRCIALEAFIHNDLTDGSGSRKEGLRKGIHEEAKPVQRDTKADTEQTTSSRAVVQIVSIDPDDADSRMPESVAFETLTETVTYGSWQPANQGVERNDEPVLHVLDNPVLWVSLKWDTVELKDFRALAEIERLLATMRSNGSQVDFFPGIP